MTSTPPIPPTADQQQISAGSQPGHQKSAKLSIAALIMGIIALVSSVGVFCIQQMPMPRIAELAPAAVFLFGILAVIFGIIALITKRPQSGLAVLGIGLGGLGLLGTIGPVVDHTHCHPRRTVSMANLHCIGKAIKMYEADYDQYPQQLSQLIEEGLGERTLYYPGKRELGVAYFYLAPAKDAPAETIMACEKAGFDENDRNVLSADGSVQRITNDEFAEALAKPHNAKFAKALKRAEGP
ncbi:MAG: DUF308 domain-containing protein [Phycisphaerae bacterium]|nr:DUF308 domain-containing protein [Phycisphaerae bacterium]